MIENGRLSDAEAHGGAALAPGQALGDAVDAALAITCGEQPERMPSMLTLYRRNPAFRLHIE